MSEFNLSEKITNIRDIFGCSDGSIDWIEVTDVKEFIRREINRRQREIDILVEENSGESISKAEELEEELNKFKKDAGEKLK